jgi:hypothetical protein
MYNFVTVELALAYGVTMLELLVDDDVKEANGKPYYFWESRVLTPYLDHLQRHNPEFTCSSSESTVNTNKRYHFKAYDRDLATWPLHPILDDILDALTPSRTSQLTGSCQSQVGTHSPLTIAIVPLLTTLPHCHHYHLPNCFELVSLLPYFRATGDETRCPLENRLHGHTTHPHGRPHGHFGLRPLRAFAGPQDHKHHQVVCRGVQDDASTTIMPYHPSPSFITHTHLAIMATLAQPLLLSIMSRSS